MATTNSVKLHKLRKLIAWLSDKEGKGMEFISLYIPREKSIDEIVAILKKESDSAITIKLNHELTLNAIKPIV
jgi:peptide subunit release factor 1 (eRF1)